MVPKNHPNAIRGRQKKAAALALADASAPVVEPVPGVEPELDLATTGQPADDGELPAPRSGFPVRAADKRGVYDDVDDRETPPCVFVPLDEEFHFTLDAAANEHNRKCNRYCTRDGFFLGATRMSQEDGLAKRWQHESVWVNPPFSGLRPWVEKAWDDPAEVAVMLLPNNRSEQPFWQQLIEPYRDRAGSILTTRALAKRRPFLHMGKVIGNRTSKSPPFGLIVVIWDRRNPTRATPASFHMEHSITSRTAARR